MGDARGCRGGFRRGLRRCRLAPRCRSLCCRLMASALFRYARGPVPPKRRAAALIGFAPFPLPPPPLAQMASSAGGKSLRARCGVPLRPPVPLLRRLARQRRRAAPPAGSRHPIFFWSGGGWLLRGHSAAVAPFAGLAAGSQGRGACFSGLWPPRRCGGAPLRSGPAPRFWPRGGAILFSLRRVWGLRRLRAALKVYRAARAAQCRCGVHGFATLSMRLATQAPHVVLS